MAGHTGTRVIPAEKEVLILVLRTVMIRVLRIRSLHVFKPAQDSFLLHQGEPSTYRNAADAQWPIAASRVTSAGGKQAFQKALVHRRSIHMLREA